MEDNQYDNIISLNDLFGNEAINSTEGMQNEGDTNMQIEHEIEKKEASQGTEPAISPMSNEEGRHGEHRHHHHHSHHVHYHGLGSPRRPSMMDTRNLPRRHHESDGQPTIPQLSIPEILHDSEGKIATDIGQPVRTPEKPSDTVATGVEGGVEEQKPDAITRSPSTSSSEAERISLSDSKTGSSEYSLSSVPSSALLFWPHIRMGEQYQCDVEDWSDDAPHPPFVDYKDSKIVYDASKRKENEVDDYLDTVRDFILGSAFSEEIALDVLHKNNYDAAESLRIFIDNPDHQVEESPLQRWTEAERDIFAHAIESYHKDLRVLKAVLPRRDRKEIVRYYYLWKKKPHLSRSWLNARRKAPTIIPTVRDRSGGPQADSRTERAERRRKLTTNEGSEEPAVGVNGTEGEAIEESRPDTEMQETVPTSENKE